MPKKTAAAAPAPEKAPAEKKKAEKGKEKGKASASPAAPAPAKKEAKAKKKWSKYTIFNSAQSHFRRQTLSWVYIMQIGLMLVNKGSWRKIYFNNFIFQRGQKVSNGTSLFVSVLIVSIGKEQRTESDPKLWHYSENWKLPCLTTGCNKHQPWYILTLY